MSGYFKSWAFVGDMRLLAPWVIPLSGATITATGVYGVDPHDVIRWSCAVILLSFGMSFPLDACLLQRPMGYLEAKRHRRAVARRRAELTHMGLTPERYMATIDPSNVFARARAAHELGLD